MHYQKLKSLMRYKGLAFVLLFAFVGCWAIIASQADAGLTISGYAFKDANRNGTFDTGEAAWAGQRYYLLNTSTDTLVAASVTDAAGRYAFTTLPAGEYNVVLASDSYWPIRADWICNTCISYQGAPSYMASVTSNLVYNFGYRSIVKSTDATKPISSQKFVNGLDVRVYNDVIKPQEVHDGLLKGTLPLGAEAATTVIRVGLPGTSSTTTSATAIDGKYISSFQTVNIGWDNWSDAFTATRTLFHEYGHAWSLYYAHIAQQDVTMKQYIKARGLEGNALLGSSYAWDIKEIIAEDYRQLFGESSAAKAAQVNTAIPRAADVPGLKEYLTGPYMKGPLDALPPTAPANLTASSTTSSEGAAIKLTWTASSDNLGVDRYDVYRNGTKIAYVNGTASTYYNGNLPSSTIYQYYVKAVDAAGNQSAASNTVSATTPAPDTQKPSTPGRVSVSNVSTSSATLSWGAASDNMGIKEYRIYSLIINRKAGNTQALLATVQSPSTRYTLQNLSPASSTSYFVTAVDLSGNEGPSSNTVTVKTSSR